MTEIITYLAILIVVGAMLHLFIKEYKSHDTVHKDYKSLIFTLGIFGTFLGITIGLLGFDTQNISQSIPDLLNGLKFAFITSLAGMTFSIILSYLEAEKGITSESNDTELLKSILNSIENFKLEYVESFKTSTQSLDKNFEKINDSLREAIETLSKGATEEIIKALEQVIVGF